MSAVECPLVATVEELREVRLAPNRDTICYVKLRNLLGWLDESLTDDARLLSYEYNRGKGVVSKKTKERIVKDYHPESFGTLQISRYNNNFCIADGHSRCAALKELHAQGALSNRHLQREITINIAADLLQSYVDANAADIHKNSAKVQNPHLLVGALSRKFEAMVEPGLSLPVNDNTGLYTKLGSILVAYNRGLFEKNAVADNITALNTGNDIWRKELLDLPATATTSIDLSIDDTFKEAFRKYCLFRKELEARDNSYAAKAADSIGLASVMVIEYLTDGQISEKNAKYLVDRADFQAYIADGAEIKKMCDIFWHSIENVSSSRKQLDDTKKQWRNIVKILTRRFTGGKPAGLEV